MTAIKTDLVLGLGSHLNRVTRDFSDRNSPSLSKRSTFVDISRVKLLLAHFQGILSVSRPILALLRALQAHNFSDLLPPVSHV